jgi:phospholipid/cholesterol/gamma-HCH transport system substrate-binding protein
MKKENSRNIRLGLVVLIGTAAIVAALYYVGSQQRLFSSTLKLKAEFYNVSGLRRGNSVRFTGIDIGTVESIEITSDTSVLVTMAIDADVCRFIKKDAVAVIGTDGVMGNKLINITPTQGMAAGIEDGDKLRTLRTVEMDATFRTLNNTNENLNAVSEDLRAITEKLNSDRSLLNILLDRSVSDNVQSAIAHFRYTGENTAVLTGDLRAIVRDVREGQGTAGLLLTDPATRSEISRSIVNIHSVTDSIAVISGNFNDLSKELKNGEGILGVLVTDTLSAQRLERILDNLEQGSDNFNSTLINLQRKWPFKDKKQKKRPQ